MERAVPEATTLDEAIAAAETVIGQYAAFFGTFELRQLRKARRIRFALTEWDRWVLGEMK